MPKCDICEQDNGRRKKRIILGRVKMICWNCWWQLEKNDIIYTTKELGLERAYSRRLRAEINKLSEDHEWTVVNEPKKYPYSNPWSAVPPTHVLKNAVRALNIQGKYDAFPDVVGDYYGIETPPFYDDPSKVPKNAIACYYPSENKVYSKGSMSNHTAFHELYHALERHGIVPKTKDTEKNAEFYADACISALEGN